MIFDMHCHILPGVDDGARNENSTDRMLSIASQEGIDCIVATPHFAYGQDKTKLEETKRKYREVRALWKKTGDQKELFLGNEIFYSEGVVDSLQSGNAMTINNTQYVLIEFGVDETFSHMQRAVQRLRYAGYIPIFAHVERYRCLNSWKMFQNLIDMGAYMQVNASTLTGKHGFFTKYRMMRLMKKGLVHFVATDAHDSRRRRPEIKVCKELLEKELGKDKVKNIFEDNPIRMLKGEELNGEVRID